MDSIFLQQNKIKIVKSHCLLNETFYYLIAESYYPFEINILSTIVLQLLVVHIA